MEVTLDAAPLFIGGARDPGAGPVQLGELAVEVHAEPGNLDGEPAPLYRGTHRGVAGRARLIARAVYHPLTQLTVNLLLPRRACRVAARGRV